MTLIRSKAPLRLGLAGGGTDVSPYSDQYGGYVLNATINMYAHCSLEVDERRSTLEFVASDLGERTEIPIAAAVPLSGGLQLHRAVYNRVVRDFNGGRPLPVRICTWADAPAGSGLGTSSTMVVAILAAFRQLLSLPLGEYDLAHLAFEIERIDCALSGGKQDQYAATFGGFNFMEFYGSDRVVVNPLRVWRRIENELEESLLLYFTGRSRESARIIDDQVRTASADNGAKGGPVEAMHRVKQLALEIKELLLKGDVLGVQRLFKESWEAKKRMSASISTSEIERLADRALSAGARAVKISGAGGGGFMMIFVDPTNRHAVANALAGTEGQFHRFNFTNQGAEAWEVR